MTWVTVTREEFERLIDSYPRKLVQDVNGTSEPPFVTYNDFSLGKWPESVVAGHGLPEEDRTYYRVVR